MTEGSLYEAGNATLVHHVQQALRAHKLFTAGQGLHRSQRRSRHHRRVLRPHDAGAPLLGGACTRGWRPRSSVTVQPENVTLASITFQNYFRLYKKLAGMTGTASTEADEFAEIYNLDVVEIPTNRPVSRLDGDDEVYRTGEEKLQRHRQGDRGRQRASLQPMLVGTTSIERSEQLGDFLAKQGYKRIDFSAAEGARTPSTTQRGQGPCRPRPSRS